MKKFYAISIVLLALTFHANAKVWRVNNTIGLQADFTTIIDAVNAAAAGDTIYVEGSATSYTGTTINKKLTIIGPGIYLGDPNNGNRQWNVNVATVGHLVFAPGSAGSKCAGLYMNSYQYLNEQKITIERCFVEQIVFANGNNINCDHDTIRQCVIYSAIVCQPNTGTFSAQGEMVYNNIINAGIDFSKNMANTSVYFINNDFVANGNSYRCQNCVFQNNIFYNPFFSDYGSSNYFANNIVSTGSDASKIATGNNNLFSVGWSTLFATSTPNISTPPSGFSHDGQFILASGSPAIGAGSINGTTVDCGFFGGAAPYILSGMPNIPSIYALSVPAQVNNGTQSINISLSSAAH